MTNLFEKAKTESKPEPKKSKKDDKVQVEINGLEELATIKTVMSALEGLAKTVEDEVKGEVAEQFLKLGKNRKPDNFRGVEGDASASCELRKRSSRSVLSEDEQEFLKKNGISTEVKEEVTETFVINPAYKDNQELLSKVSEAISGVDGLPEDFIVHQAQKATVVTTKNSLDEVFALKDDALKRQLMEIVGTLAVKPTLDADIQDAVDNLKKLLG